MKTLELSATFPATLDFLRVTLAFVRECAFALSLQGRDVELLVLAVEEAVTNVIHHGLADNPEEQYTVLCRCLPASLEVVIQEKGIPFAVESAPQYHPEKIKEDGNTAGLGMYLLEHAVDQVKFINLGRGGKETILIKHLPHKRIDTILSGRQGESITAPVGSWHVREFREDDAPAISRCAWQAYGYSYEPYIYYPDMIVRMNREGQLHSLVAVDETEQLLGHIGLKFYHKDDPTAEVGVAFVEPSARNLGVFSALFKAATQQRAVELGLLSLYDRTVTSHTLSQKISLEMGFHPAGIFLGLFPTDVDFKKLTGKIRQKESGLLFYKNLDNDGERIIFPPPHHREIISRILAPLKGIKAAEPSGRTGLQSEDISMETSKMDVFNSVDIRCFTAKPGTAADIRSHLHRYCMEHVDVIYLHLNLEDEATPSLAAQCETMGFFFSGVLPYGLRGRHCLILQYCNNLALQYENIKVEGPVAAALKEYIRQCDPNQYP